MVPRSGITSSAKQNLPSRNDSDGIGPGDPVWTSSCMGVRFRFIAHNEWLPQTWKHAGRGERFEGLLSGVSFKEWSPAPCSEA